MRDARGEPITDADVTVAQRSHAFGFGNIGFEPLGELAELWLHLFNSSTLPFYWQPFEPVRGRPDTQRLLAAAQWFVDRGVRVKGHPLVWHTLAPQWALSLDPSEVEDLVRQRIRREVGDFRELATQWDVINETVILPDFDHEANAITTLARAVGRQRVIALAFEEARAADPTATLLINDFDLGDDYERIIGESLAAGVSIDAIGLQTHMHQGFRGEDELLAIADRFSRFGLPLHFTETTLLSGDLMPGEIVDLNDYVVDEWPSTPEGEQRQADELERHYRALVGHPAVESITCWGFTDDGAWLGAPAGLVRSDGTPKPAYDRLASLVKGEWWLPPTVRRTDGSGRLEVSGFRGEYELADGSRAAVLTLGANGDLDAVLR